VSSWGLCWVLLTTSLQPENLPTYGTAMSGQKSRRAKYLGGKRASALACFVSGFLSQPHMARFVFCRQVSSEALGQPSISMCPSDPSCAQLAAHSQPLCCAMSSCRDSWAKTLLLPAMGGPFFLPMALVNTLFMALEPSPTSQSASLSLAEK